MGENDQYTPGSDSDRGEGSALLSVKSNGNTKDFIRLDTQTNSAPPQPHPKVLQSCEFGMKLQSRWETNLALRPVKANASHLRVSRAKDSPASKLLFILKFMHGGENVMEKQPTVSKVICITSH